MRAAEGFRPLPGAPTYLQSGRAAGSRRARRSPACCTNGGRRLRCGSTCRERQVPGREGEVTHLGKASGLLGGDASPPLGRLPEGAAHGKVPRIRRRWLAEEAPGPGRTSYCGSAERKQNGLGVQDINPQGASQGPLGGAGGGAGARRGSVRRGGGRERGDWSQHRQANPAYLLCTTMAALGSPVVPEV